MIDLRNLGGGKKLIKEIIRNSKQSNQPWTKKNQYEAVKKQKNIHTPHSRPNRTF
jgi:hypothetical protein